MSDDKSYTSLFVTGLEIDLANYVTENFVHNYLVKFNKAKPNCAFWRTALADKSDSLYELAKRYQLELIGVKRLLTVFSAAVILQVISTKGYFGFNTMKMVNRGPILNDLFEAQHKYYQELDVAERETLRVLLDKRVANSEKAIGPRSKMSKLL